MPVCVTFNRLFGLNNSKLQPLRAIAWTSHFLTLPYLPDSIFPLWVCFVEYFCEVGK